MDHDVTLLESVISIASEESGVSRGVITEATPLATLFSDSLEFMEFIVCLKSLGEVSDSLVTSSETIGDLANGIVVPS